MQRGGHLGAVMDVLKIGGHINWSVRPSVTRRGPHRLAALPATDDPYRLLEVLRGSPFTEIKAAYYAKMKELHPDVNPDRDTTDDAVKLNLAYTTLFQEYSNGTLGSQEDAEELLDAFDVTEADATELFINPFACLNANPLLWEDLQDIARDGEGGDPEEALRRAGAGPSEAAIHWLTPNQLRAALDELARMGPVYNPIAMQSCAFYMNDCLQRARLTNDRAWGRQWQR